MELKLYPKDVTAHSDVSIEELSIEHFPILGVWSFDRITYYCPTGLVKYLKHEDKNLIGKIGVENLSDESLNDDGWYWYPPIHEAFLDKIYNNDKVSHKPVVTIFSERINVSHEKFKEIWNEYPNKDRKSVIELIKTGQR